MKTTLDKPIDIEPDRLKNLVKDLRAGFDDIGSELKAAAQNATQEQRPSEAAMQGSEKFKGSVPEPTPPQRQEAEQNLDEAAKALAATTGKTFEQAREDLQAKAAKQKWEVHFAAIPEGPFYRPKRMGVQKQLTINTDHPFYKKVYEVAGDEVRGALEVLLLVLAERELECRDEAETFYKAERNRWSERLRHALEQLMPNDSFVNKAAAVAERMYEEPEPSPVQ